MLQYKPLDKLSHQQQSKKIFLKKFTNSENFIQGLTCVLVKLYFFEKKYFIKINEFMKFFFFFFSLKLIVNYKGFKF